MEKEKASMTEDERVPTHSYNAKLAVDSDGQMANVSWCLVTLVVPCGLETDKTAQEEGKSAQTVMFADYP